MILDVDVEVECRCRRVVREKQSVVKKLVAKQGV